MTVIWLLCISLLQIGGAKQCSFSFAQSLTTIGAAMAVEGAAMASWIEASFYVPDR